MAALLVFAVDWGLPHLVKRWSQILIVSAASVLWLAVECRAECSCSAIEAGELTIQKLCICIPDPKNTEQCQVICSPMKKEHAKTMQGFLPKQGVTQLTITSYDDTQFPDQFLSEITVQQLVISHSNSLNVIERKTFGIVNVGELTLDSLETLLKIDSKAFAQMTSLSRFVIMNCKVLKTGDFDFSKSDKIMEISITGTAITTMEMPMLNGGIDQAASVKLELRGNKLICDCAVQWVKRVKWKQSQIDCEDPKRQFGKNEITPADFKICPSLSLSMAARIHNALNVSRILVAYLSIITSLSS